MTTVLGIVCLMIALVGFLVGSHLSFHEWGYRKGERAGRDEGYLAGRKAADDWWLGVEAEIDRARQKIWREEAQP